MPDSEGFLTDNEVVIAGKVWEWREIPPLPDGYLCEEEACEALATLELSCYDPDPDSGYWICLCDRHFEARTGA